MQFSPNKTIDVLGIGSALMDIQVQVNDEILSNLGLPKGNMTLCEAKDREKILKALINFEKKQSSGGSIANSLTAIKKMGGASSMFGCVGDDHIGRAYSEDMKKAGVDFLSTPVSGESGTSIILITPDAERTMVTTLGCAPIISKQQIHQETIAKSKILYIEGYLWDSPETIAVVKEAIAIAKENNTKVAFSASDSFCVNRHRHDFLSLLENDTDIYFANAEEAKALIDESDLHQAIDKIKKNNFLVITDGKNGSYLIHDAQKTYIESRNVIAKDTTGAGDTYAAGILYGLATEMNIKEMGELASNISAEVVKKLGARY